MLLVYSICEVLVHCPGEHCTKRIKIALLAAAVFSSCVAYAIGKIDEELNLLQETITDFINQLNNQQQQQQ